MCLCLTYNCSNMMIKWTFVFGLTFIVVKRTMSIIWLLLAWPSHQQLWHLLGGINGPCHIKNGLALTKLLPSMNKNDSSRYFIQEMLIYWHAWYVLICYGIKPCRFHLCVGLLTWSPFQLLHEAIFGLSLKYHREWYKILSICDILNTIFIGDWCQINGWLTSAVRPLICK